MTNRVKRALREGRAVFGPIIQAITSPSVVRLMAIAGFDFVYLDMEHGPFTISQIGELCQVARASDIVPIVRPPFHRADQLSRPLDVAVGTICFDEEAACQWLERGVRMLNYSSDVALLTDPAAQVLRDLRRYCGNRGIPTLPE